MQQNNSSADERRRQEEFMQEQDRRYQEFQQAEQARIEKMTAEQAAQERRRLEALRTNTQGEPLPPPPQPPERLATYGTPEEMRERHERAEDLVRQYQSSGDIAAATVPKSSDTTAADHALDQERAFRERQQELSDEISKAPESDQRERLEVIKTTEYHQHKAEQLERIIALQQACDRDKGTDPATGAWLTEKQAELDDHKAQGAAAVEKLDNMDRLKSTQAASENTLGAAVDQGRTPTEASAPTQAQGANPAAERLRERQETARQGNDADRTPEADQSAAALNVSREKLEGAQRKVSEQEQERAHAR